MKFPVALQKDQCLRDLHWVVESPSLLGSHVLPQLSFGALPSDRFDGEDLMRYLRSRIRSHRVGDYFEALVLYAVRNLLDAKILYSNHQVFHKGSTVGEIDCIYLDAAGKCVHLEIAFKVFLAFHGLCEVSGAKSPEAESLDRMLIGPNPADNLAGKLQRLREHQLPMSQRLDLEIDERQVFVKGRIHYPWSDASELSDTARHRAAFSKSSLSNEHLGGWWIRNSQLDRLEQNTSCLMNAVFADVEEIDADPANTTFQNADLQNSACVFIPIRKPFWLSEVSGGDFENTLDLKGLHKYVHNHFDRSKSALLFSMMALTSPHQTATANQCGQGLVELARFFVVDDEWPGRR